ncbi:hypothetical protein BRARA_A03072 [Brassica rapa]|uniref:Uncharacterized protein n=1 Tax=Brassica campestris TaxID=3711 RepID=A0A398ARQ3_BRACM|nr:hypothetical protein BRARA_A03072 [Brassica rapa]
MENPPDQTESKEMMLQPRITRPKGGLLTMPFIIANEGFEKVASYGLLQNMILYLMSDYGLGLVKGQNVLFMWVAATNFMPLVGAFLSDSYLGRFLTISIASLSSFLGMMVLWLTAMLPQVKPSPCVASTVTKCSSTEATSSQLALLYFAFALISIGSGGIRPCSLAFGADQLDNKENPKNERVLESFFDNINKGHYDYYYWVLAILSFVNVIYYIVCSWSYGPTMDQLRNDKVNGVRGEEQEEAVKLN